VFEEGKEGVEDIEEEVRMFSILTAFEYLHSENVEI